MKTTTAAILVPHLGVRLSGALLAAIATVSVVAALAQSLHVGRLGQGVEVVTLERVTVTAQPPAAAFAALGTDLRRN